MNIPINEIYLIIMSIRNKIATGYGETLDCEADLPLHANKWSSNGYKFNWSNAVCPQTHL